MNKQVNSTISGQKVTANFRQFAEVVTLQYGILSKRFYAYCLN
jgi:hypothetical protein